MRCLAIHAQPRPGARWFARSVGAFRGPLGLTAFLTIPFLKRRDDIQACVDPPAHSGH
jgi:hypothetical protein